MKIILYAAIFVSCLLHRSVHTSAIGGDFSSTGVGEGAEGNENQNLEGGHFENQEQGNNELENHNIGGEGGGGEEAAAALAHQGGDFQESHHQPWHANGHTTGSGFSEHFGGSALGELNQGGHGLESINNIGELAGHGVDVGGHGFGGHEHLDLHPKVEVQHDHIPTKTIEKTETVPVTVVKKIGVPVPHPVGVPTPQVFKVAVPQPYAVHIPVPHPIKVPIYKLVPQEIERRVPITVEKLVPVYIDKPVKIEIEKHHVEYYDKPYPVHVPVYKHIFHHTKHHHHHR